MRNIFILAAVLIAFSSCRKYPDFDELSYQPVVITNYDPEAEFHSYHTFYISDDLTQIGDDPEDSIAPPSLGDPIISTIIENMEANDYTRVSTQDSADLGINVAAIKITNTVTTYPPGYWWGYPGYGGCYYGYCGYYPTYGYGYYYGYSYSYNTGTLLIQVADLVNVDSVGHKINIVWTNWNSGVLGASMTNVTAAVAAVNQAFDQSPYFKHEH